jgi:hypothetical protein
MIFFASGEGSNKEWSENPAGAGAERKKGAFRGKAVVKCLII